MRLASLFGLALRILVPLLAVALLASVEAQTRACERVDVVEHAGDNALRDELIASSSIWYDAGEFLVGQLSLADERALGARHVAWCSAEIENGEELCVVQAAAAGARGERTLHASARQALVARETREGAVFAHGQGALVRRVAMRPCPTNPQPMSSTLVGDPHIQSLVDGVDENRVLATVQSLSAITTRRATQPGATTAQNLIVGWLQALGLTPTLQTFSGSYSKNVIAELPGLVHPERIVVIGAHYDSINGAGSSAPAPGADDNASGSGGVLEVAHQLVPGGPYENTLRFVFFSAEEFGLVGSGYAATQSQNQGEEIVAMINLDMLSYKASGDARDVDFATNNTSASLTAQCRTLGQLYVPNWASTTGVLTAGTSDHQSYFSHGYPAVFPFEDMTQYSPYIHTANDTHPQSTNDPLLARMVVQGVVACGATLAVPSCAAPLNYCVGAPNSAGPGATMGYVGSTRIHLDDLQLSALGCPGNVNGIFFWGTGQTQVPLGNGWRCVGSSFVRFGVTTTNAFGDALLTVDLGALPGGATVAPGDVRNAQFWYRDVPGGGALYNLSDALQLTFCP